MALGPTLGTGVFIGAGQALAIGGPGSLLISYIFLSLLTYFMATSVAEVATHQPSKHGTTVTHGFRYMTNSMGFAAACLRWYTLAMFVPYEISSAMVNLGYWTPDRRTAGLIGLFIVIIVGSNFLPSRQFRKSEIILQRIKMGTLAFFLIMSLSIALGGASGHDQWGFRFWKKPGAFHEYLAHGPLGRFWALLQSLLHSSIAFTLAPELIVQRVELEEAENGENLQGSNSETPLAKSSIPRKINVDVAQTAILYILSSLAMGLMVPYNEPLLTNGLAGTGLSPFVIVINKVRIRILPVTATIAISVSSIASARSFLRLASETLCTMAEVQRAPSMFTIRNQGEVPWVALIFSSTLIIFGFLCAAVSSSIVTTYFMLFVNSSGYLSSLVSCSVYWHFRRRLKHQGLSATYKFAVQPFGTYFGFASGTIMLVANGLISVVPGNHSGPRGCRIIMAYISIPIFCAFYLMHQFSHVIPTPFHSHEGSTSGPPKAPNGTCQLRPPPPVVSHTQHGRSPQPPPVLELDQLWVMARER